MKGYLLVRVASAQYGVPVTHVRQVLELGDVTPAPRAHEAVLGVTEVAGRLTPVVHLGGLLSSGDVPVPDGDTAVLAACGHGTVALAVDEADAVILEEPEPLPTGWQLAWASGVARVDQQLIPIIDMEVVAERLSAARAGEWT